MATIAAWGTERLGLVEDAPAGSDFIDLSVGDNSALALDAEGAITAWGWDAWGHLGSPPEGTGFTAVAAGRYTGLALAADGSIEAWGRTGRLVDDAPAGSGHTAIALADDGWWAAALDASGAVVTWGSLSDHFGSELPRSWTGHHPGHFALSLPPTGNGFVTLRLGFMVGAVLDASGNLTMWGWDKAHVEPLNGAFEPGMISDAPAGPFADVQFGPGYVLGLRPDGSLVAWGPKSARLGSLPEGTGYTAISAGWGIPIIPAVQAGTAPVHRACALDSSGSVVAWGMGAFGSPPGGSGFTKLSGRYVMAAL